MTETADPDIFSITSFDCHNETGRLKRKILKKGKICRLRRTGSFAGGLLTKKLLKRGNFDLKESLREKLIDFIEYFNENMAKPYRWTFDGLPLKA